MTIKNMRGRIELYAQDEFRSREKGGFETPGRMVLLLVGGHTLECRLADNVNSVGRETIDVLCDGDNDYTRHTVVIELIVAFKYAYHPDSAA